MDIKGAAKAVRVPHYRLRDIEECSPRRLRAAHLRAYIELRGLEKWFARWSPAVPQLAARLAAHAESE